MKAWTGAGFPLALLLAVSALTLWLKHAAELPEHKPVDKRRHDPDTIIERFTASALDARGVPLHHLSAERLVRFADDGSSDLANPVVRYTPQGQSMVTLTARRGRILAKGEEVHLHEQVRVEQAAAIKGDGWVVTTEELKARPDQRTAEASGWVRMEQGLARIDGIGFTLDMDQRTASLNASVRGSFPPRGGR